MVPALQGLTIALSSIALFTLEKKTKYGKLSRMARQVIAGILFGVLACLCTRYGYRIRMAVMNVRDAAPLGAALFFGAPAGIIAGVIGAVHRLLWGAPLAEVFTGQWLGTMFSVSATGGFTRAACSIGTLLAGLIGAYIRKVLLDDKPPSWMYAGVVGFVIETIHMFLIFVFRLNHVGEVYDVVSVCTMPMVVGVMATCIVTALAIRILYGDNRRDPGRDMSLSAMIQRNMFLTVAVAFFLAEIAIFGIQYMLGLEYAEITLKQSIGNVENLLYEYDFSREAVDLACSLKVGMDGSTLVLVEGEDYEKGADTDELIRGYTGDRLYGRDVYASTVEEDGKSTEVYCDYLVIEGRCIILAWMLKEEAMLFRRVTIAITVFLQVIMFAMLFMQNFFQLKRSVINNLSAVNGALTEITSGDLDAVVDVRTNSEFTQLSDRINTTVDALKDSIKQVEKRMESELAMAHEIQVSALPGVFPPYPSRKEFEIYASMDAAKEVGGDFYDFFFIDDERLALLMADVSGKGVPAALFMMKAKTIIKSLAESGLHAEEVLTRANAQLCEGNDAEMFVTTQIIIVNLTTGQVNYSNAGHNFPFIRRKDTGYTLEKLKRGLVLAGMDGVKYKEGAFRLEPGDAIFMYTDGVTEAENAGHEQFGEARVAEVLNRYSDLSCEALCCVMKKELDAFAGDAPQFDDQTMLSFKYYGLSRVPTLELENATEADLVRVTDFVEAELEKAGCPRKPMLQIDVAIDEIFSNIIHHGYHDRPGPIGIRLLFKENPTRVTVCFEDRGFPYNPLVKEDPDVTLSAEERAIGGLGILMVKKSMDDVRYRYEDGKNILSVTKRF